MADFELTIQFTQDDTKTINSEGFVVAIVKGPHSQPDPKPLWAVLVPFEKNVVAWQGIYGLYASPDPVEQETVISASSTQYPAEPGVVYPFTNNVFDAPTGITQPGDYAVENNTSEVLTFGLAQTVTANGKTYDASPVNALAFGNQMTGIFEPTETISVFLHKETVAGAIIIVTESAALTVDMAANPTQTIHYNGSEFVLGPLA
jgi:hypothetical protein